ncbi:MAG TPA: hypothetical protein VEW42_05505 [Candidatus Eisenbacteria bacterium]|nr:hypothetical protein [Candidatus Eisenbacteria bacterium]
MAGRDLFRGLLILGGRALHRHYSENPGDLARHARIGAGVAGRVADAAVPAAKDAATRALDAAKPVVQDAAARTRRGWRTFLNLPQGARIAWRKQHGSESQQEEQQ